MDIIAESARFFTRPQFDGSAFVGEKMEEVRKIMDETGFKYSGKEVMYDGRTGKPFPVEVFIGVVYYQKLPSTPWFPDKIHAIARG